MSDRPPDHRTGAGALDGRAALGAARRDRGAVLRRRLRDLRPRQRARARHRAVRRYATSCRPGVDRPSRGWRWPRSPTRGRWTAGRSWSPPRSVGPGALNMVTAAGLAHANRLPVLLLPGDTFTGRAPGPGAPAGRALRRPDHVGQRRLPAGVALLRPDHPARAAPLDAAAGRAGAHRPRRRGPVTLALPQDVQAEEYDFPAAMFAPTAAPRPPRPRPDTDGAGRGRRGCCGDAERPLLVLGGGVRYSGAGAEAMAFAETAPRADRRDRRRAHPGPARPPVVRRRARHHRLDLGQRAGRPRPTSSSPSARDSRTSPPPRGPAFAADVRLVTVNAARFDAVKHNAHRRRRRRAREPCSSWPMPLGEWTARPTPWARNGRTEKAAWDEHVDELRAGSRRPDGALTYAQVTGVVNDASTPDDYVLTASGGMPGELHGGWRTGEVKHGASARRRGPRWTWSTASRAWATRSSAPWGAAMARAGDAPRRPRDLDLR